MFLTYNSWIYFASRKTLIINKKLQAIFISGSVLINRLSPEQNDRYFADIILKCILLNENHCVGIEMSLIFTFVHKGPIGDMSSLVHVMVRHLADDWPLS